MVGGRESRSHWTIKILHGADRGSNCAPPTCSGMTLRWKKFRASMMTYFSQSQDKTRVNYSKIKVVFSCLYGEPEEFLKIRIFNFMVHTDESALLVINVPEQLNHKDESEFPGARLLIKKHGAQRAAWGHTLLGGHIENLRLAEERVGSFDHFVAMASNSLFVRPFDLRAAVEAMQASAKAEHQAGLLTEEMPDSWHWPSIRRTTSLTKRLSDRWRIDRYLQNQIEGLFASRVDWQNLGEIFDDIKVHCEGLTAPLEEILPATAWRKLGNKGYAYICHMYWDRYMQGRLRDAAVDDVLNANRLPQHVVMLKWFGRNQASPESLAVGTSVGLELTKAIKSIKSQQDHIGMSALIREFGRELRKREERTSIFSPPSPARIDRMDWINGTGPARKTMRRSIEIECEAKRQVFQIEPEFIHNNADGHAPYIYMEGNGLELTIRLRLFKQNNSADLLRIDCACGSPIEVGGRPVPTLVAYLYLPLASALSANNTFLSLQVITAPEQYSHTFAQSLVLDDKGYRPIAATQITAIPGGVTASYIASTFSSMPFIGVPIYANSAAEVHLDFVRYLGPS